VEAEFARGLGRRSDELADGVEDDAELAVVFFLHFPDLLGEVAVGIHEAAELDEGAHDGDVHLDGPLGPQHAGKHGHALLGEGVGEVFPMLALL